MGADNVEIEVFSQDEMDARIQSEKEILQTEYEQKISENKLVLDKAMEDKATLETQMAASGGGNKNFAALKDALSKKDEDIKSLREGNQKIMDLRTNDLKSDVLSRFSGVNVELAKKISHHYDVTLSGVKAESKEEITKKMESAARLSMDDAKADIVNQANFNGGTFGNHGGGSIIQSVELSNAQKDLGKKLGITDEDIKKYGPKLK